MIVRISQFNLRVLVPKKDKFSSGKIYLTINLCKCLVIIKVSTVAASAYEIITLFSGLQL